MYRKGHYGAALLVWAPVGAGLFGVGMDALALVGGAGVLALARLPDYDLRVPFLSHRGPTHTVGFALLVGAALAGAVYALGRGAASDGLVVATGFAFAVGVLSVGSHLLADALTPAGIEPFWPVSNRSYSFDIVRADSTVGNYALLALGVFVSVAVVLVSGTAG